MPTRKTEVARAQNGELESLKEWYRYNSYVRKKYLELIEKLPRKVVTKDTGASHPSILDIFAHVLDAYRWWFIYAYSHRAEDYKEIKVSKGSVDEIKKQAEQVDSYVMNFMEKLTPKHLSSSFHYTDEGKTVKRGLKEMLYHMVEEELQHRGELNALLWQVDVDPPVTSWRRWKVETGRK